jgi:hypothetical protein
VKRRPYTQSDPRLPFPQDPLFPLAALTFRPESRQLSGAACFDFFWARNAIYHGLRAVGIQPGQRILVPAYICSAAIEPIEYFGAEVAFYAIQRNCAPDWQDLEAKIRSNVRAILAVHYFGFPCDLEKFSALCNQYNLLLIEDCAHVLEGAPNRHRLGEVGDFSVYSPRKHLPVFDGGRLRLKRPAAGFQVRFQFESPLFTLREAKNLFERRKPSTASWGPEPEGAQNEPEPVLPEKPLYVFPNSTSFLPWMADFPMSRLSKRLHERLPISKIASKRRTNYSYLLDRVLRLEGVQPLWERLPVDVVPWVLPLMIGEGRCAHTALRALGIPAVTWGGVRHPRISAAEFPEADDLYERLVFLPIHQDLETAHLELIADAVNTVCRTRRD